LTFLGKEEVTTGAMESTGLRNFVCGHTFQDTITPVSIHSHTNQSPAHQSYKEETAVKEALVSQMAKEI
jgi:hypothetical protein